MREALALLVPTCAIALLVLQRPFRWNHPSAFALTSAFCLGIGLSSVVSVALLSIGLEPTFNSFIAIDVAIWTIVGAVGCWSRLGQVEIGDSRSKTNDRMDWYAQAGFVVVAIVAFAAVIGWSRASPLGEWDAWAIWNQHARFLFRGGGSDAWRAMFQVRWAQPDYPLLLPATVARVWAYAGGETSVGHG